MNGGVADIAMRGLLIELSRGAGFLFGLKRWGTAPGSRRRYEFCTLARALALAALEASSQTILDLGNRPVAPKEVTRLCTVSFSKPAAVRSDA